MLNFQHDLISHPYEIILQAMLVPDLVHNFFWAGGKKTNQLFTRNQNPQQVLCIRADGWLWLLMMAAKKWFAYEIQTLKERRLAMLPLQAGFR